MTNSLFLSPDDSVSVKDLSVLQAFSLGYLAKSRHNKAEAEGSSRFSPVGGPIPAKSTSKDPSICYSTRMGYNT